MESLGKIKQRHKREERELENELKDLKKKNKWGKAEAEAKSEEMKQAMLKRHAAEIAAAEEAEAGDDDASPKPAAAPAPAPAPVPAPEAAAEPRVTKAQQRRAKKADQERERRAALEEAKANHVDTKQIELDAIQRQIADLGLTVHQIPSDGHCLYRAVAEQLTLAERPVDVPKGSSSHQVLRQYAAAHIRDDADSFAPFILAEMEDDSMAPDEAIEAYCHKLETTAAWGGQPEILALCHALHTPIVVYQANAPAMEMGHEYSATPLRISFHREYYALGDHYNSIVPKAASTSGDEDF